MDFNKQYCTTIYNNDMIYNDENEDNQVYESQMGICEKGSDELLIDAIRNYPHLYNPALKEFKDSQMKENSWIEISNVMDMSIATCQNRWVRLRDRFSKEKRLRETETRSGSGASHRSGFPLYNNMLFLENYVKRRKSYTNVTSPTVKKQLVDISNTSCHNTNIATSNISSLHQAIPSIDSNNSFPNLSPISFKHSKVSNTDFSNVNLSYDLYRNNISIQSQRKSIINFIPIHPNIQESNIHQTENVIQSNRLFLPSPQCETYSVFDTNETTSRESILRDSISRDSISRNSVPRDSVSRDSVPRDLVLRDSVPRDSVSRDSTSRNSVSRDLISRDSTASPALQTLPINTKIDRLTK